MPDFITKVALIFVLLMLAISLFLLLFVGEVQRTEDYYYFKGLVFEYISSSEFNPFSLNVTEEIALIFPTRELVECGIIGTSCIYTPHFIINKWGTWSVNYVDENGYHMIYNGYKELK